MLFISLVNLLADVTQTPTGGMPPVPTGDDTAALLSWVFNKAGQPTLLVMVLFFATKLLKQLKPGAEAVGNVLKEQREAHAELVKMALENAARLTSSIETSAKQMVEALRAQQVQQEAIAKAQAAVFSEINVVLSRVEKLKAA